MNCSARREGGARGPGWSTQVRRCLLVLSILLMACSPERHSGMLFRGGSVGTYPDGTLRKGDLVEPTTILGIPFEGWVHFHESGKLSGGRIAEDTELAGHSFPAGTTLWFDEGERLKSCCLSEDVVLDGIPCNGGPGKFGTYFHPDGSLKAVFLPHDTEIQGVPCRRSLFHPAKFDPKGRLVGCQLARSFECGGCEFPGGSVVVLNENGLVTAVKD